MKTFLAPAGKPDYQAVMAGTPGPANGPATNSPTEGRATLDKASMGAKAVTMHDGKGMKMGHSAGTMKGVRAGFLGSGHGPEYVAVSAGTV